MTFQDAIRSCFARYVGFQGRAGRPEFWWFFLFCVIAKAVARWIDRILFGVPFAVMREGAYHHPGPMGWGGHYWSIYAPGGGLAWIVGLALFLPQLAVAVRRLHDTGHSGWWLLLAIIPFLGWLVLLIFFIQTSGPANAYGAGPDGPASPGASA